MTTGEPASGRIEPLVLVGLGGLAGAVTRHSVTVSVPSTLPWLPGVVWGTLVVNVLGSFGLGVLLYRAHHAELVRPEVRLVVGGGFLASFTTYSTFAHQTAGLTPGLAVANVGANYGLGFLAVLAGHVVARWGS